ncbi:hypothetical protein [Nostoc sp. TCL26-01]|uniref:hypothetical protein n=1 Tax=Nostoc sp. TCL26-01 TaxID=2576904 RepID=UPI0015B84E32|nr:hypothetical protein [Nostoc sp. TCL26-01]QLE57081.1 hypothetical protein FD725_17070 [Nostoc sp. TCL26-01]
MVYSKDFPENCPPPESIAALGEFYRLLKKTHEKPRPEDFLSWRQEYPNKECPTSLSECQACGLSIHSSLSDVRNLSLRIPRFKNTKIAQGKLSEDMGNLKHTPSKNEKSHHTWWITENSKPWEKFNVIDLSGQETNKT